MSAEQDTKINITIKSERTNVNKFAGDNNLHYSVTEQHVRKVIDAMLKILCGKPLSKSNIIHCVYAGWSVTRSMNFKGSIKKQVLLCSVRKLIESQDDLASEDKQLLMLMIDDLISELVDVISDAKKGGSKSFLVQCLGCCLGVPDKKTS